MNAISVRSDARNFQIATLGVFLVAQVGWFDFGTTVGQAFVTRMHVRYAQAHFPEDLALQETPDTAPFQVRYVMHQTFPAERARACRAGRSYLTELPGPYAKESANLADLTGWKLEDIKAEMARNNQAF